MGNGKERSKEMTWVGYKNYDHYYWVNPQELPKWYNEAIASGFPVIGERVKYYNVPASFAL